MPDVLNFEYRVDAGQLQSHVILAEHAAAGSQHRALTCLLQENYIWTTFIRYFQNL